jgi:hypothetical protein
VSAPEDDGFLQRWLRRKNEAAAGVVPDEAPAEGAAPPPAETAEAFPLHDPAALAAGAESPAAEQPLAEADAAAGAEAGAGAGAEAGAEAEAGEHEITDDDLPDLSELGEDSDYSMFMAKGVSREKRQAALRQLFRSPKFNVTDGLDDYCEDFTKFEPLGDIVTADMRHHAERLARKALEALEGEAAEPGMADAANDPAGADPALGSDDHAPPAGPSADASAGDATETKQPPAAGDTTDSDEGSPTRNV